MQRLHGPAAASAVLMAIPDFELPARHYPDHWNYPLPDAVKRLIGGEATDCDVTNTYTIRLSHALNSTEVSVPRIWQSITNRRGANDKYCIIRVAKCRTWIELRFGKPGLDLQKKLGAAFSPNGSRWTAAEA